MAELQNAINANATTPLITTQGGTGLSNPTAHGILIGEGASAVNPVVLSAGQILIGTTSADPSAATLTQGTGITITSASGSIAIASSTAAGGGFVWNDTTGTSATIAAGNGYVADNAALVTFTLPATSVFGDCFCIQGKGAGGWKIAQNAGQQINFGNASTLSGSGGSIASNNQYDSVTCVCVTAGASAIWAVRSSQGQMTVT